MFSPDATLIFASAAPHFGATPNARQKRREDLEKVKLNIPETEFLKKTGKFLAVVWLSAEETFFLRPQYLTARAVVDGFL